MEPDKLTRSGLLSGMFTCVVDWLCPRRFRAQAAAEPHIRLSIALFRPSERSYATTYTYDEMDRLSRMTVHMTCPIEPLHGSGVMSGLITTFDYSNRHSL